MPHRDFLEAARAEKSDVTLQALCDRLSAERGVKADTSMMSRFFRRIGVTVKKRPLSHREQDRPDISRHRKRWRTYQGLIDPRRLVFIDETWTKTNMTRLRGWAPRGERLRRQGPAGQVEDRDFPRRLAQRPHRERPACSTGPSTASASTPMSNSSSTPTLKPGDVVILDNLGSHKGKSGAQGDPGMSGLASSS